MAPTGSLLRMVDMIHRLLSPTRHVSLSQCFFQYGLCCPVCQYSALSTVGMAMVSTVAPLPAILPTLLQWSLLVATVTDFRLSQRRICQLVRACSAPAAIYADDRKIDV
jgi:hypothetical protein